MKAVKLDEKTITIALTYGKTVNRGVLEMEKRLKEGNHQVTDIATMGNPQVTDEEYWNHMEALLKKYQKGAISNPPVKLEEKAPVKETGFHRAKDDHPDKMVTNPDGTVVKQSWNQKTGYYEYVK